MGPSLTNDKSPTTAAIREDKRANQIYLMSEVTVSLLKIAFSSKWSQYGTEHPTEKLENGTTFIPTKQ